ncbi:hypothetical protein I4U23_012034 [Adineta vaga]|nr:hypothetical protein I4U23_012034 [Adineta vaga]
MLFFRRLSLCLVLISILSSVFFVSLFTKYFIRNDHHHYHKYRHENKKQSNSEILDESLSFDELHTNSIQIGNHPLALYVHFDLKGAAPKSSYFEKLFPLLHQWGVKGICMEYEDMFPFDGIVSSIKHKQAYTKYEIKRINQLAKQNQLDVMPLLQTYGHLEFLLKLDEFRDLREDIKYPQVITPCINKTYTILYSMIDQYLELHPNIHYLHIGHDEVYYFLTNPACQEFQRLTGIQTQYDLFAYHLNKIVKYIKQQSPNIVLFIWHDVLQNLNLQILQKYDLINLINPVLWSYREDIQVEGFVSGSQADLFGQYQILWGATAFKGATHETATISDVKHYYENQISWIKQLQISLPTKWKNFNGVILTGWSRYDHFLSLCELLPYSIPSMLFSISAWYQQFQNLPQDNLIPDQLLDYVQKQLECSTALHLNVQDHLSMKPIPKCKFPGADIYESMILLSRLWNQVEEVESFVKKYVTDLHIKYNYIHVKRGEECLERLTPVIYSLKDFMDSFMKSMNEVFPPEVAIEWLETYFMQRFNSINKRYEFIRRTIREQKSWLVRPITKYRQSVEYKIIICDKYICKYSYVNNCCIIEQQ